MLIVRDGWGRNPHPEQREFNAIELASTPVADRLLREYPWTTIATSGEDVGLPAGTMGNSEVGHQNLGAGRVVDQDSVRITKAIRDGSFFDTEALVAAVDRARERGATVHLLGIASDAGVHGLLDHLYACLELCRRRGTERVAVHLFTDGRDTGPYTGEGYVEQVVARCAELGVGHVASLCGRYYAMDRDNRWGRVHRAYDLLTGRPTGEGDDPPHFDDPLDALRDYYEAPSGPSQKGDEFVTPRTVGEDPAASRIADGDTVIFTNYRTDRPREISRAFVLDDFHGHVAPSPGDGERGFDRGRKLDLTFVTMTAYDEALAPFVDIAFPKPPKMDDIGGAYLARLGLRQFRCAETEKFPHVTFFFNDGRDEPFPGEARTMPQSPRVATYDLQPAMSAHAVRDAVLGRLAADDCEDFFLVNFANTDMVGHTGVLEAAITAAETVDACVGTLVDAVLARGGRLIVTADHGNAEQMWDPATEAPHTAHTTYDVDLVVVDPELAERAEGADTRSSALRRDGRLADVFPTLLQLFGLAQPAAMSARSLLLDDP
ncbi:MAG: 2,3-bisphosphoglycerate-independent phosphoglycerate mutase [Acidobacteriota bacterium]